MAGIFISYRRDDSAGFVGRLADALKLRFPDVEIFRDVDTLAPGDDFVDAIDRAIASCSVLLAVIGPAWLAIPNKEGGRRLDDQNDYVRREIASALMRKIIVIPVLVSGARMPDASALPAALQDLSRKGAQELSDKDWDYHVDKLFHALESKAGLLRQQPARSRHRNAWIIGSASAVAAVGIIILWPRGTPCHLAAQLTWRDTQGAAAQRAHLDVAYAGQTTSFPLTDKGSAPIEVGPLTSSSASWTITLKTASEGAVGTQTIQGCPAVAKTYLLRPDLELALAPGSRR